MRLLLTLIYISILWAIIGVIAVRLTETQGIQIWGLIVLCFVGAICHVGSVAYYDLARRLY